LTKSLVKSLAKFAEYEHQQRRSNICRKAAKSSFTIWSNPCGVRTSVM